MGAYDLNLNVCARSCGGVGTGVSVEPFGGKARLFTLVKSGTDTVVAVKAEVPTCRDMKNECGSNSH